MLIDNNSIKEIKTIIEVHKGQEVEFKENNSHRKQKPVHKGIINDTYSNTFTVKLINNKNGQQYYTAYSFIDVLIGDIEFINLMQHSNLKAS